ncbi:MAG: hypothetical protein ACLFV6_02555 [Spirulinaceae cyanobacterium]
MDMGLQNAANDGFAPMTQEFRFHGSHCFNSGQFLEDPEPKAIAPTGLNFDEDGNLLAVFWTNQKYDLTTNDFNALMTQDPAIQGSLYKQAKASTVEEYYRYSRSVSFLSTSRVIKSLILFLNG